ncbi:MAG TPA: hypothetical protein VGH54_22065 [Mycobacterium sp.]|jgi:hypothetical protein|uniref:hypothetical protein n=1 Tax=Mycobacterium sp. TaxID=1785 RepID=UPI002F40780F
MPTVSLGNPNPIFNGQPSNDPDAITKVVIPDGRSLDSALRDIIHTDGLWRLHSTNPPTWVESDDPELAEAIAKHFGCPVGRPTAKQDDEGRTK